jgi:hypothetical protein
VSCKAPTGILSSYLAGLVIMIRIRMLPTPLLVGRSSYWVLLDCVGMVLVRWDPPPLYGMPILWKGGFRLAGLASMWL